MNKVWIKTSFVKIAGIGLLLLCGTAQAGVTPWVDMEVVNGHIRIASEINGVQGYSVIDTGSTVTGINSRFLSANELDLRRGRSFAVTGVNAKANRSTYVSVPVTLFGSDLVFGNVTETHLGSAEN